MSSLTTTLTFCECAENHVGMEQIGTKADTGYSIKDLQRFESVFKALGSSPKLITIPSPNDSCAAILVIPNGVSILGGNPSDILSEHLKLEQLWDKKALMGRGSGAVVKNKNARHNLCFADRSQDPKYEEGLGRIINFSDPTVPLTKHLREALHSVLNENGLFCEANYYYDIRKTYIGFHGDTERRKVIGARFGSSMPLYFHWFYRNEPVGKFYAFSLDQGDIYIMSEKAVGTDWKKSSEYTLRHAAGLESTLRKTVGPARFFTGTDSSDIVYLYP